MNVSAVIVTRGDVSLDEVLYPITASGIEDIIIWNNGECRIDHRGEDGHIWPRRHDVQDLSVYGRYAAIEYAKHDLIYVQDDDVLHQPEGIREITDRWHIAMGREWDHELLGGLVCNMPANFRHDFYTEHSLVGFGAVFHRDAPFRAFAKFWSTENLIHGLPADEALVDEGEFFHRTCDIVFTGLMPRILVDVPYEDASWASAPNRMWKQPEHRIERRHMLDLVLKGRDG